MTSTKVVFRKFKKGGDIIALFPREAWDDTGRYCASYMQVGQHSPADPHLSGVTVPAKESEYAPLLAELKQVGYRNLVIGKVVTRDDDNFRIAEARRRFKKIVKKGK